MTTNDCVKCLIVDDVPQNLIALEALLQRDGVIFLKAHSGQEALELLLQNPDVALALLDVQMPEMNGFELAELIRGSERTRHIPLIFMTAGSRELSWQFKGYESGAVDFLFKPIDPHMLVTKANVFFELHRRKQELTRQLQERTEALRINEMFMAVLSHDLRNPLQIIKTVATLLKRQSADEARAQEFAERLLGSSQRMGRMIEDLLDVTRIRQAGGLRLSPTVFDLDALCAGAVDEMRACFPERAFEYQLKGDPHGTWDGERLAQVLSNILGNAVQHGDPSQPIHALLDGTQASVVLSITNGGTIPGDLLPVLFSPFRGGERQPGQARGLGLGLYIAQQIVRSHGGEIEARSEGGQTCFKIVLPRYSETSTLQTVL